MATAGAGPTSENTQWLTVTEEGLFLHDGLLRVTDLVELPKDVENYGSRDNEVLAFDSKDPTELCQKLLDICGTQNNSFSTLLEYRLNALKGLWNAQNLMKREENGDGESSQEDALSLLKKQVLLKDSDQSSFSTRISLLLILPLLQSQSKTDPDLCAVTSSVILNCLHDCPPFSLAKEPSDCLNGLESLLCGWLGEKIESTQSVLLTQDKKHQENAASALIALACARGHVKTLIHAVHLLQQLSDFPPLPVRDLLASLLDCEGTQGLVSAFLGSKYIISWGLDDLLDSNTAEVTTSDSKENNEKEKEKDPELGRSITTDGSFLYTTNSSGKGIAKVGTGLHGTLRGFVYNKNTDIGPGRLAYGASDMLLLRPQKYDSESSLFIQLIDKNTLQPLKIIEKPEIFQSVGSCTTVGFCSDGIYIYWLWCPTPLQDKSTKGINVFLNAFIIEDNLEVRPLRPCVTLQKKEDGTSQKSMNEVILNRLRPLRGSNSTATLMALTGGDTFISRKEEAPSVGTTSCGIPLKTLVRTPVYCDGNHLILLSSTPGAPPGGVSRSLFGTTGPISNLRSLASNMCFNIKTGLFSTRIDLMEAAASSVGRGTLLTSIGACFDISNNLLWMSSGEYVDQFQNPGNLPPHHVHSRLGISGNDLPVNADGSPLLQVQTVLSTLLHTVGSMCLHQMSSDSSHRLTTPHSTDHQPPVQPQPLDICHLGRVTDILARAVTDQDQSAIVCSLVVLQHIFKTSPLPPGTDTAREQIKATRTSIWQLLTTDIVVADVDVNLTENVKTEACRVVTNGLRCLYPAAADRHRLLYQLLTSGQDSSALTQLRDMLLTEFSGLLNLQQPGGTDGGLLPCLILSDDLVTYILKLVVKESCTLLRRAEKCSKDEFETMIVNLPCSSPAVLYLTSLRSYFLRCAVLHKQPEEGSSLEEKSSPLESIQSSVQSLSSKLIAGACEVLEAFLSTCQVVLDGVGTDVEGWLCGLERLAKSTVLGSLMPVLITVLTHPNLQCLDTAAALTPSLVRLSLLASHAAMLMKSQEIAAASSSLTSVSDLDFSSDKDIADLLGEALNTDQAGDSLDEEEGFLTGIKIPTPWASGKTLETIHPVRDNYKFKESVHIPGARCLYLRFDNRCSSQYDYDKVVIYAGSGVNGKKVAEYGGNSLGFGGRSVLGSGWPKDLVKVEGDTVTVTFEMRSGREHNTPDKAMWGCACTIRAQESAEEVSPGLPFLSDLALGLSVLVCTQIALLYHGAPQTDHEKDCQHLLKSKLLQRCQWNTGISSEVEQNKTEERSKSKEVPVAMNMELPRIKITAEVLEKLRLLVNAQPIKVRPSLKDVLAVDLIEESMVSAVAKHLGVADSIRDLKDVISKEGDELTVLTLILEETYRRFEAFVRQLKFMADLEQRWESEVEAMANPSLDILTGEESEPPFFHDFHLQEARQKELSILAFLKDVPFDITDMELTVKSLLEKFESEKVCQTRQKDSKMNKTKTVISGILSRLELLLHVDSVPMDAKSSFNRTLSHAQDSREDLMVKSDTDVQRPMQGFGRSVSAPVKIDPNDGSLSTHRRREKYRRTASILQDLVEDGDGDKPPHVSLIDQLFSFIGSDPEKAVSSSQFIQAVMERHNRGCVRVTALRHIKDLLVAAGDVGGATHLVAAVASVLKHGPKADDLRCGGMVSEVREAYADAMSSVVQLAARYPIASASSIGLLCTVPFTRAEEKCLVRSGLVHLLDRLCGLGNHHVDGQGTEMQTPRQKVSALAWAGFQVLASRCVKWEVEDVLQLEEEQHSGLAKQVSMLLTHHLARATDGIGHAMADTEALQEVLSLLNNLSRSKMGSTILSQPACVSKLLSLLLDQRPSPKLVLIILQLCRVSLPLMNQVDCEQVELPAWGQQLYSGSHLQSQSTTLDPPDKIICLLLAKLGDFVVPGEQATLFSRSPSQENSVSPKTKSCDRDKPEEMDIQRGKLSVFVHKREDQSSHDIIQPLLSCEYRPFRLAANTNMDKVLRLDREIAKNGKAELTTDDAVTALKKAYKWAQMGLAISTSAPTETNTSENNNTGDKKKTASEVICKEKNSDLARSDPVRAFISSHVANAMAAEVIALLHNLHSSPSQTWSQAVHRVLSNALSGLPVLVSSMESLTSPRSPRGASTAGGHSTFHLMSLAKLANASLCALGGFDEMLKPGCEVEVTGEGVESTYGSVVDIVDQNDMVTVLLHPQTDETFTPTYSNTIKVPLRRVRPIRNELFSKHQPEMTEAFLSAVKTIILPKDESVSPLTQSFSFSGDGNAIANQICRVLAEIRTRTTLVLSQSLKDISFAKKFIQHCGYSIDMLKSLAKECHTGSRMPLIEAHCQRLRMLYRDCAKPPAPPSKTDTRPSKEMLWDVARPFPPARACLFSHAMTSVVFLGDPSAGAGLPRGTMIYANQPIPKEAPSFYWELEVASFGETQDETGAVVSFGFAPPAEKKDGAWTNPVGTCLFLNTGKAVHYNGASLLQWRSVRLEVSLSAGDVAGIGWEKVGDKGQVYFTYNGQRLSASLDNVQGAMYPVVHIQKKNCRIKANFGAKPFAYAEGQQHRDAAEAANDILRDIRESFGHLPFHMASDSESELTETMTQESAPSEWTTRDSLTPPRAPCRVAEASTTCKEYDSLASLRYKLLPCYDNLVMTGPDSVSTRATAETEDSEDEAVVEDATEDHYALLVKAWEQKVFPVIRRRFRNEAERKDGLEQIRGALQLGMTDIARQTVEFLYEENGGIPRDLHLPTLEDIKDELAKFTIDRVKKGTTVIIRTPAPAQPTQATTQLPKFAIRSMLKTFGLTGTVLDLDSSNELVQVETYLRSEGVLVRFWYPLTMLEKPAQALRKSSMTGGQTMDTCNIFIHRELVSGEKQLAHMYLRAAFCHLSHHCNSPAAMELITGSTTCTDIASLGADRGMAACAATLQELDLENIQLLSEHLLSSPYSCGGVLGAVSPSQGSLLSQLSLAPHVSLTSLVYGNSLRLKRELAVAIARASHQGEDYLIELTNQLCMCLQTAPEMFPHMSFPVNEAKVNTDIHFPGAACILVSCVQTTDSTPKENPPYRSPWARISTYTGKRIKKCGQVTRQEVVVYPRDPSSPQSACDQLAPAIVPGDTVYVKLGVSPPPGICVTLHALPPQFLLAVAYMETLVTETFGCGVTACGDNYACRLEKHKESGKQQAVSSPTSPTTPEEFEHSPSLWSMDNICVTPPVFLHMIEFLCGYLWRTEVPALLKEYLFHLLAQTLRVLHYSEGCKGSCLNQLSRHRLSPTQGLLSALPRELMALYDLEVKGLTERTTSAGQGIGLGVSDSGQLSTYLQALTELCLAISEVIPPEMLAQPTGHEQAADTAAGSSTPTTPSPSGGKKKKLKLKKERAAASSRRMEQNSLVMGGESPPSSSTSLPPSPHLRSPAASSASSVTSTPPLPLHQTSSSDIKTTTDNQWFPAASSISKILRYLALKEDHCQRDVESALKSAAQCLTSPTSYSRLIILTGIPNYLDQSTVRRAIIKTCTSYGGLDRNEVFVPEVKQPEVKPSVQGGPEQVTSDSPKPDHQSPESSPAAESHEFNSPTLPVSVFTKKRLIEGYAVFALPSKTKVEIVRRAFLKTKWLNLGAGDDESDSSLEVLEENLMVQTVNQSLLTEPEANGALEKYLFYKLSGSYMEIQKAIGPAASQALSEIFYSCYFVDQQQDSGDICLSKDQILNTASENLLAIFMNSVRPSKKPMSEAVTATLRQYGIHKAEDKDLSEKSSKGKGSKKPASKSQKERHALNMVEKSQEEKSKASDKEKKDDYKEERLTKSEKGGKDGAVADVSKSSSKSECNAHLTLDSFMLYCEDLAKQDIRALWKGLFACGLDLHLERCMCPDVNNSIAQQMNDWSVERDSALVHLVNEVCCQLAVSSARLHPHEIWLSEEQLTSEKYSCLQGVAVEHLRLRFAFLQNLNNSLETMFLPLVDLRPSSVYSRGTAFVLSQLRTLLFYDTKINFFNRILNATAKRKTDQAAPEITLNPLESIGTGEKGIQSSVLCQSYRQLSAISSRKLCVRLACGGDPTYAFNVRLTGEEVHGTSGSFRHYLWQVSRELESQLMGLFITCPSSSTGVNKSRLILKPGKMTYSEENLLIFVGQLLGITMRADIPLGFDLLSTVWKLLVGQSLDGSVDLEQADSSTYSYLKKLEMCETETELLESVCGDRFVYNSLTGHEMELVQPKGAETQSRTISCINWDNRHSYIEGIKSLRLRELTSSYRVSAMVVGLSSIVPYQLLSIMSARDLELRTSGRPQISLDFLKSHTMYQVGLVESDPHIEFFWSALESFSQEELAKFIKFACNQERVPQTCPCQEGGPDSAHVPPYPMKIAPPDGAGVPDTRYIRVETCMFMVKLPQYSSQEVMSQRLRYAINCREDPLSG